MIRLISSNKSARSRWLLFLLSLLMAGTCFLASLTSAETNESGYFLSPDLIGVFEKGPNAQVFVNREMINTIQTEKEVNKDNHANIDTPVKLFTVYRSNRGNINLELEGRIQHGMLEINFPLGRVDAALFKWSEMRRREDAIMAYNPKISSIGFRDRSGFEVFYLLNNLFSYQLVVDIPYNPVKRGLMSPQPDFKDVSEFIEGLESNKNSIVILSQNKTGAPVYITAGAKAGTLEAGYLLNTVQWSKSTGKWSFTFDDVVEKFYKYPDFKPLWKNKDIKKFIRKEATCKIRGYGSPDTGYSFKLIRKDGESLSVQLIGKRVFIKS